MSNEHEVRGLHRAREITQGLVTRGLPLERARDVEVSIFDALQEERSVLARELRAICAEKRESEIAAFRRTLSPGWEEMYRGDYAAFVRVVERFAGDMVNE